MRPLEPPPPLMPIQWKIAMAVLMVCLLASMVIAVVKLATL